jgi:two-component sensor histidine kinase
LRWNVERKGPFPSRVKLDWTERGGPTVKAPESEGFGSRLLRVTAKELGGEMEIEFERDGFRWALAFDLQPGSEAGSTS